MLYPLWRLTIYTLQSALLFNFFKDASMLTVLLPNTTLVKINKAQRKHLWCCYRCIDIQLLIAGVRRLNKRWRREQFITLQFRYRVPHQCNRMYYPLLWKSLHKMKWKRFRIELILDTQFGKPCCARGKLLCRIQREAHSLFPKHQRPE